MCGWCSPMSEEWNEPDVEPTGRVIYGPHGEKLRVWKEIGKRDLGFKASNDDEG